MVEQAHGRLKGILFTSQNGIVTVQHVIHEYTNNDINKIRKQFEESKYRKLKEFKEDDWYKTPISIEEIDPYWKKLSFIPAPREYPGEEFGDIELGGIILDKYHILNSTDAALENFKQRWELFRVACDQAEEFVESVKQRIGSGCLVDEATGSSVTGKSGQTTTGLPPISAVRLEQMSKAVRWLVIELQQGSGASAAAAHTPSSVPFDARFSEDAGQ
ncbi:mediator of RNA polymerase II transcription subunit 32-like [Papaver somniferum]|uniref:mediator of RNA polymerase II transcription subunit 32-like n=1 Tax=Papaver somniferum TaxID=3469 RepID=UPI000E7044D3|nr:mediator of RNA polymerase II transcription subunit 32-like [Papaver somniferum]